MSAAAAERRASNSKLKRVYSLYTVGVVAFIVCLGILEAAGLPRQTIGHVFLAVSIVLYATIGVIARTNEPAEYYAAGRRVPALFNGMATGADWMSAASFIGLAGGLYHQGYAGLAYVMGWTGGFVLVALLLAPYLRKFGQYTIPDFLGARYGGHVPRLVGVAIAIAVSFTYVVAQIYGVGLITTRLTGVDFSVGIFLGLAGVLVCSFLGGMKAVTWTQVAQYIILIIAYLIPVVWLSMKQTGSPLPQIAYGHQLEKVTQIEERLLDDPKEAEVRELFRQRAAAADEKLRDSARAWVEGRLAVETRLADARASSPADEVRQAEDALARYPRNEADARALWQRESALAARAATLQRHGEAFPGKDEASQRSSRTNFLALVFCLMVGTAALPHLLMRSYTTTTVRDARVSVAWSLLFIGLLYVTAPALAVLVKFVVYNDLVGSSFATLPGWVQSWARVDPSLLSIADVNGDGVVQRAEISIGQDIVMLATPEIASLPYVISGLVAAGGLAAALSTADGLLLTISNALSHDLYYKVIAPDAASARRVLLSKLLLLVVAVTAALVAAQKPGDILFMVSAAFSLAAAGFFPALVLGVFWKRATGLGATLGMLGGLGITFYYMATTHPWLREIFHVRGPLKDALWWDIQPVAAGVFGVPIGFALIVLVSWITPVPAQRTQDLVDHIRFPDLQRR